MISCYTWRDVERIFKYNVKSWNKNWLDIDVYYDEIIISLSKGTPEKSISDSKETLKDIFGYHYDSDNEEIRLDYGNKAVKVKYQEIEDYQAKEYIPIFKEIRKSKPNPNDLKGKPVIAFHSYKGGVGRTLSMISTINSYSILRKDDGKPYKLLIVDSDI